MSFLDFFARLRGSAAKEPTTPVPVSVGPVRSAPLRCRACELPIVEGGAWIIRYSDGSLQHVKCEDAAARALPSRAEVDLAVERLLFTLSAHGGRFVDEAAPRACLVTAIAALRPDVALFLKHRAPSGRAYDDAHDHFFPDAKGA